MQDGLSLWHSCPRQRVTLCYCWVPPQGHQLGTSRDTTRDTPPGTPEQGTPGTSTQLLAGVGVVVQGCYIPGYPPLPTPAPRVPYPTWPLPACLPHRVSARRTSVSRGSWGSVSQRPGGDCPALVQQVLEAVNGRAVYTRKDIRHACSETPKPDPQLSLEVPVSLP